MLCEVPVALDVGHDVLDPDLLQLQVFVTLLKTVYFETLRDLAVVECGAVSWKVIFKLDRLIAVLGLLLLGFRPVEDVVVEELDPLIASLLLIRFQVQRAATRDQREEEAVVGSSLLVASQRLCRVGSNFDIDDIREGDASYLAFIARSRLPVLQGFESVLVALDAPHLVLDAPHNELFIGANVNKACMRLASLGKLDKG